MAASSLSTQQLASILYILSKEYNTTLPALLARLDKASGDLNALHDSLINPNAHILWTPEEDKLLKTNGQLLAKWKGAPQVDLRLKYLTHK